MPNDVDAAFSEAYPKGSDLDKANFVQGWNKVMGIISPKVSSSIKQPTVDTTKRVKRGAKVQ